MGFYDTPGDARGVAVADDYAYVADGSGGLLILRRVIFTPVSRTYLPVIVMNRRG